MTNTKHFDVIIAGGSYSGLAAGMALGRALRRVLIIDSGQPCNRQTPYSHNFITQDGSTPGTIAALARQQVEKYETVEFLNDLLTAGARTDVGFEIVTGSGKTFSASKLIFATGIRDIMPAIAGYAACWGISVLHCPYCHGYEVRNEPTGILGSGAFGFEFSQLISNWTNDLTLFTDGASGLTAEQTAKLEKHGIKIEEAEIEKFAHDHGHLQHVVFRNGAVQPLKALYVRSAFEQHCAVPEALGCELNEDGYIMVDAFQKTTVPGVYACGDNVTRTRTVANAVAMGTAAGMAVNKEIVLERF